MDVRGNFPVRHLKRLVSVERLHPALPCASGGLLDRLVAHPGDSGVVRRWFLARNFDGQRFRGWSLCGRAVQNAVGLLEDMKPGGRVRLASLLHAPSNEALEIFVLRHDEISFVFST